MRNNRMIIDHRKPVLTQQLPSDFLIGHAPFTIEYSYFNCTGSPVILSLKNGLRLELRSENNSTSSGFTVKVLYKFSQYTAERLCTFLANRDCPKDDPLYPFKEGLLTRPYKQGNRFIVIIDYHIEKKEFGMKGGSIYVSDSDVLLTLADSIDHAPMHPHSDECVRHQNGAETNTNAFVYKLDLVDNNNTVTSKYTNVNGEVFRVDSIKDPARPDGLYRYSRKPHDQHLHDLLSHETYYRFADMHLAGVYDTIDEAVYNGDTSIKKKEELMYAEHQSLLKKYEADYAKQEAARVASILQVEANDRKHQQDIEMLIAKHNDNLNAIKDEQRRLQIKDHYDTRGYERKDSSEFMKHLPMIILGVGSALVALFSFL